jgi:hypothetical protein
MEGLKVSSENVSEKQAATPEESIRAAVMTDDDGEVFKVDGGKTQFRALGL